MRSLIEGYGPRARLSRRMLSVTPPSVLTFLVAASLYGVWWVHRLPKAPIVLPDSAGYLLFDGTRPPGYFAFLSIHKMLFGGLDFLPHVQALGLLCGLAALALATGWMARTILAAYAVLAMSLRLAPWSGEASVMSDPLFTALLAGGAAAFLLHVGSGRRQWLWLAVLLLTSSAMVRAVGFAVLGALVIAAAVLVLYRRLSWRSALLAALPATAVMIATALMANAQTGRLSLGAPSSVSILGKALMVARPLPADDPASTFNWFVDEARAAQVSLDRADDHRLKMLMLRQDYEYLRFDALFPQLEARSLLPSTEDAWGKNAIAARLSAAYIKGAPAAYAKLVVLDYLALWSQPRLITSSERATLERRWAALGPVAYLAEAERLHPGAYRAVLPPSKGLARVWTVRLAVACFLVASLACSISLLILRPRIAPPGAAAIVFLSLAVHGAFVATALNEAALERYVAPFWPLMVAMLPLVPRFLASLAAGDHDQTDKVEARATA